MKPWIHKYLPKTPSEIVGQDDGIKQLRKFILDYRSQKKKALILYGPPGTGKTSSVYAVADELGLEVMEVNASDTRNKAGVQGIIGTASTQRSLFAKGKVILVDEIDGLSGTGDRGGLQALISAVAKTSYPMVLTSQDPYDRKFSKLRSKCSMAMFDRLSYTDIFERLAQICRKEKIEFDGMALKSLARRSGGDMRAAINDLQTLGGRGSFDKADLEELFEREQAGTIKDALLKIFKTTDPQVALSSLDNVNLDYSQVMLWLDENLPKEYTKPADLMRAFDKLSKADVYGRRIRRWQHWRFLVYIFALQTAGVAVSKDEKYRGALDLKETRRLLKIWMANQKYAKRKAIAEKLAERTHTSWRVAQKEMPYLQHIYRNNGIMAEGITIYLELNDDEAGWLRK